MKLTVPCHDLKILGHVDDHMTDLMDHLEQREADQTLFGIEVTVGNSFISSPVQ